MFADAFYVLGLIAIVVVAGRFIRSLRGPGEVVLGSQFAAAQAAENRRLESVSAPSPMPPGDYEGSARNLWRVAPVTFDDAISEFCRRFAALPGEERESLRQSTSLNDFYTLLSFAQRMSALAMRERNAERLCDGLLAVSIIDIQRVDHRDVPMALSLLSHAAQRLGGQHRDLFTETASLAVPPVASLMRRLAAPHDLTAATGYSEVESRHGVGFVDSHRKPFRPTVDLTTLAMNLADVMESDRYRVHTITIETELPAIWLEPAKDPRLPAVLSKVRGGVGVAGRYLVDSEDWKSQQNLWFWVIELPEPEQATTLVEIARHSRSSTSSTLGIAVGAVFCLVVASTSVDRQTSVETADTLDRFARPIQAQLSAVQPRTG